MQVYHASYVYKYLLNMFIYGCILSMDELKVKSGLCIMYFGKLCIIIITFNFKAVECSVCYSKRS